MPQHLTRVERVHLTGMNTTDQTQTTATATATAGTLTLTVWPEIPLGEQLNYVYRIHDSASGVQVEGRDLFAGALVDADRALGELARALSAAGEAHHDELDHPGQDPEHARLFPGVIIDAARRHAAALADIAAHRLQPEQTAPARRWISVVFLQGEEADTVLDLIARQGTDAAIEHLAGYDYGDETVEAALENGYVHDTPPTSALDRTATRDVYTLTYNPFFGHVALLREHDAMPDSVLLGIEDLLPTQSASQRTVVPVDPTNWFAARTATAASHRAGPGL